MMAHSLPLKCFVYLVFALIVLPLLVVVGVSFNPTSQFLIIPLSPSLHWYQEFFSRPEYLNSLFAVTLPLACISSVLATIIGTLAAIALVRFKITGKSFVEFGAS